MFGATQERRRGNLKFQNTSHQNNFLLYVFIPGFNTISIFFLTAFQFEDTKFSSACENVKSTMSGSVFTLMISRSNPFENWRLGVWCLAKQVRNKPQMDNHNHFFNSSNKPIICKIFEVIVILVLESISSLVSIPEMLSFEHILKIIQTFLGWYSI